MVTLALLSDLALARDYSKKGFDDEMKNLDPTADLIALYKDFAANTQDMETARKVASDWSAVDSVGALDFYRQKFMANSTSTQWNYLYGRLCSDSMKIALGHKIIGLDPKFSYGYRLLLTTYNLVLFNGGGSADLRNVLKSTVTKDGPLFETWVQLDSLDAAPPSTLFNYYLYTKQLEKARASLDAGKAAKAQWADDEQETALTAASGKYAEALTTIGKSADDYISQGQMGAGDRDNFINSNYVQLLRRVGAYSEAITFLKAQKGDDGLYALACISALNGQTKDAMDYLAKAIDAGQARANVVPTDDDLITLHKEAGWNDLLKKLDANKDKGAAAFKDKVLASKIEKDAPDWTLTDVNGQTVKLSDLKGQVVLLDFWATWCNPCRMAMPVLSNYMKTQMPQGVKVFSINVWERGPVQKATIFMKNKGYAMTLLYGNNDLSTAYGFQGIPYLCAIDKNGKIRYAENGYEDDLGDRLPVWVDDLLK
jgi:thiol-disulfide isomerase/thioredoxin